MNEEDNLGFMPNMDDLQFKECNPHDMDDQLVDAQTSRLFSRHDVQGVSIQIMFTWLARYVPGDNLVFNEIVAGYMIEVKPSPNDLPTRSVVIINKWPHTKVDSKMWARIDHHGDMHRKSAADVHTDAMNHGYTIAYEAPAE